MTNRELLAHLQSLSPEQLDKPVWVYNYDHDCFYGATRAELVGENNADLYRVVKAADTVIYMSLKGV